MTIVAFLLLLVPLVVIHEAGHFFMAKLGGIRVTKFCIGFGKKLFGYKYRGTEYCWNILPFGGYVDFMGDLVYTGRIPEDAKHFYNRPKWIRFLVLVMGPLFNLLLAFGLYWMYYSIQGTYDYAYRGEGNTVGMIAEQSPEFEAGLRPGDRILKVDGENLATWDALRGHILLSPNKEVSLDILRDGESKQVNYTVMEDPTEGYGLSLFYPNTRILVAELYQDYPAHAAGMLPGDIVLQVNGIEVDHSSTKSMQEHIAERAPEASDIKVLRNGQEHQFQIVPKQNEEGRWLVGVTIGFETTRQELSIMEAFPVAWEGCKRDSTMIYNGLKKLVQGLLPIKMLSGPVGIARVAKQALDQGWLSFLMLAAALSLNLGIMNLLPIPVLDGGEILVLLIEGITGKDFSLDTKWRVKLVGLFFLIGLMAVVVITDVMKFF